MKMPNINMNLAGVAPFNWQMLMTHDIRDYNILAIRIFSQLDNNTSVMQMAHNASTMEDKVELLDYGIVAENIVHELAVNGITLEDAYPSIVKYLFTGANATKLAHKQMFWRVFGDYACKVIEQNTSMCHIRAILLDLKPNQLACLCLCRHKYGNYSCSCSQIQHSSALRGTGKS